MPDSADLQRLVRLLTGGGGAVLARRDADGEPVGSARFVAPTGGMAEVVAVAVAATYRRLGVGTALLAAVSDVARRYEVEWLWLTPAGDAATHVYRRVGYRRVADAVHMAVPV